MAFEEYFSFKAIVGDLIRWRVAGKGTRGAGGRSDVEEALPPRRMWSRAGTKARKGVAPVIVRRQAIWRTVVRACGSEGTCRLSENVAGSQLRWAQNLMKLVNEVREVVLSGKVAFEKPRMIKIPKGYRDGVQEFRDVASFDRIVDRVILSRMTAYVRDKIESVLTPHCYSFRKDASVTHQTAIERLQRYRAEFPDGSLFVGECDIKRFFDSISHDVVRRRWREIGFAAAADKVLEAYLAVFSTATGRGLPQGGSFSTVLANLVLAAADEAVLRIQCENLFYARFCDDVVFVHPEKEMCRLAMSAYGRALAELDLPMHPVQLFAYKPLGGTSTVYYEIKSKGPFAWRQPKTGEENCAPWLSFLGSQIRFNGETRIRKESIEKHIRSLGRETSRAVREIGKSGAAGVCAPPGVQEWFARFRNRLIAKGVGYVTAKVEDCRMCWAGAFPNVTDCADTRMQMRRLDRVREGMLCKVWRMLPERARHGHRRYKGRPFSYFGFLEKAMRPTNMARRRVVKLPYSEL